MQAGDYTEEMSNVIRPEFRKEPATFTVEVHYDPECSMWVGECGALCFVTEARSFEALCERVWLVAEDAGHENGLSIDVADMRLIFVHQETAGRRVVG